MKQGIAGGTMKEIVTTLTKRGQVTVPVEVRRLLGLKPRDKVTFTIDHDEVHLRPAAFTLETAFGSVPPLDRPMPVEEMVRIAKDERVRRYARKQRS